MGTLAHFYTQERHIAIYQKRIVKFPYLWEFIYDEILIGGVYHVRYLAILKIITGKMNR